MNDKNTILILGANSDIAIAVAHKFAINGFNIQLAARNIKDLDFLSNDLMSKYNVGVCSYEIDITKYESFKSFILSLNVLPDIALCSIGIMGNQKIDEKEIYNSSVIMKTNYEGPSILLGEIANCFEERGSGSIIGISSVAGERGRKSNYIYGSAKAGFTCFLSGLRNRLYKSNVNVLSVLPGFVATKMTHNLDLPKIITAMPSRVAKLIFQNRNKSKILLIFPWNLIMHLIIKRIPEIIFKRLSI